MEEDQKAVGRRVSPSDARPGDADPTQAEIRQSDVKLVVVQTVVCFGDGEFGPKLRDLRQRTLRRLDHVPEVSDSRRLFGYWQFIDDSTRVYFAGIQVDSLESFRWDYEYGLAGWDLGPTNFAVFCRKGVGSTAALYKTLPAGYRFDARFLGGFEGISYRRWLTERELPDITQSAKEVWIPVVGVD
jgi:hypothetical protein